MRTEIDLWGTNMGLQRGWANNYEVQGDFQKEKCLKIPRCTSNSLGVLKIGMERRMWKILFSVAND
jgi:hypothetical protein